MMNIDYSQFLNMIPEVTLMAVLVIVFIADLFSAIKPVDAKPRKWFNPLVCGLMLVHILVNIFPVEVSETFGGMYWRVAHSLFLSRPVNGFIVLIHVLRKANSTCWYFQHCLV